MKMIYPPKRTTVFNIVAVLLTFIFVVFYANKGEGYWGIAMLALAFLIVGNFDLIKKWKLSAGGFEAETREVLTQTQNTLEEVKELATLVSSTTLSLVKSSGRIGGYTDEEEESIRDDIFDLLRKLSVPEEQISNTLTQWHRFVEHDYRLAVTGGFTIPKDLPQSKVGEWKNLREGGIKKIATPNEIENFFKSMGMLTDDRRELIADFRHYKKHRQHRRLDVWSQRHELFLN